MEKSEQGERARPVRGPRSAKRIALVAMGADARRAAPEACVLADFKDALEVYASLAGQVPPEIWAAQSPYPASPLSHRPHACDTLVAAYCADEPTVQSDLKELLGLMAPRRSAGKLRVYGIATTSADAPLGKSPLARSCDGAAAKHLAYQGELVVKERELVLASARKPRMGIVRRPVSEATDRLIAAVRLGRAFERETVSPGVPAFLLRILCRAAGKAS